MLCLCNDIMSRKCFFSSKKIFIATLKSVPVSPSEPYKYQGFFCFVFVCHDKNMEKPHSEVYGC